MEDSCGERAWVDLPHFKTFTDNFLSSFGTLLPTSSLLPSDGSKEGGSSPLMPHSQEDSNLQEQLSEIIDEFKLDMPINNR